MDEPMIIIRRHHKVTLDENRFWHALSELSAVLGGFLFANDGVLSWAVQPRDEEDETNLLAQLSTHGVFIDEGSLSKRDRYLIAGACYFYGIPLFLMDDIIDMAGQEIQTDGRTIN